MKVWNFEKQKKQHCLQKNRREKENKKESYFLNNFQKRTSLKQKNKNSNSQNFIMIQFSVKNFSKF